MRTFALDTSSADRPNRSGVEWYAHYLIEAMKNQPLAEDERLVLYSPATLKWPLPFGWMKGRVSWEMLRRAPSALLVPAQGLPLFGTCATVVHDVGFARVPGVYEPSARRRIARQTAHAVRRAKLVFAVSEFTKREVAELYKVDPAKIVVAQNAVNASVYRVLDAAAVAPVTQKYRLGRNFFLYVGRLDMKKNLTTLIRGFEHFKAERGLGDPFELILVGSPGFGASTVKQYVEHSPARDSIRALGYVPEEDVAAMLNAATAFVFPSWYEGFGVPPLEAAACGCPAIVSDIAAHREVMQDAALFVPPGEPEAWTKALQRVAADRSLGEALKPKGFARAAAYSWDATAKIVLDAMRNLVS